MAEGVPLRRGQLQWGPNCKTTSTWWRRSSSAVIRATVYTREQDFACREGEQSLATATAMPNVALVLAIAIVAESNRRLLFVME